MELTPYLFWNIFITLVLAPILYSIRQNTSEAKRIDILLNKTREEMAREYVTKTELKADFDVIITRIDKLGEKIDKLFDKLDNREPGSRGSFGSFFDDDE